VEPNGLFKKYKGNKSIIIQDWFAPENDILNHCHESEDKMPKVVAGEGIETIKPPILPRCIWALYN
jgi:hypothetical protein